jgi:hypothetical protein
MTVINDNHIEAEFEVPFPQRVVDFITSRQPLRTKVTTAEIATAVGIDAPALTSRMRTWFNGERTQGADFSHIHRIAEGIRAFYWYDPDVIRTEGAVPLRAVAVKKSKANHPTGKTAATPPTPRRSKKSGVPTDLFAQITFDKDGRLMGIANDGRPFVGTWLVPQVPQ